MNIIKNLVDKSKYAVKCPYEMKPTRIVVHETANDASAKNEIAYMCRNNNQVSFHYAVDDKEIVQGIPENRNAWHSGDGNGKGNREGIAIEICYSKSGDERWQKSVDNAAQFIAELLKERGWGVQQVTKHQDYSNKNCPHRILESYGWQNFINLIQSYILPINNTNNAIFEWQKSAIADGFKFAKYGADGIWGDECEAVAKQAICKKRPTYKYKNLTKIIQKVVGVEADGLFGNNTKNAVIEYQKRNGLVADGEVGINTWKKMLGV